MTELGVSVLFLLFSMTYVFFASQLSFGDSWAPKAGFLPMISGMLAIGLSIAVIIKQLSHKQVENQYRVNWRKFIFISIGLIFYIILLKFTSYSIATMIIMFYLLKVADTSGWLNPLVISAGSTMMFYLIFERFLGTPLP